ncbi:MAG: hypothetical protein J0L92_41870 [Deltaproteobacteria bacterium]|nr:hypothetical protein [Deltaproteobacteria bacterium]
MVHAELKATVLRGYVRWLDAEGLGEEVRATIPAPLAEMTRALPPPTQWLRAGETTLPLVEAVALDPRLRFGEPYLLAGDCLLELGKHEEAIDAFDRFLSVNTSSLEGHVKKARAHRAADEKDAAKKELEQALSVWAQIPGFQRRNQLGWWLRAHVARVLG